MYAMRLICWVFGHRWERYWTPMRTFDGYRCSRCKDLLDA